MSMRRYCLAASIVFLPFLPLVSKPASSQGLSIQPRATIGYQYYEFDGEEDGVGNQIGDIDYQTDYLLGGVGLSVQYNRFFADLYGQTNLSNAEDNVDNIADTQGVDSSAEIDRYELNLALGYAIIPSVSVSGGVKYARTKIDSVLSGDAVIVDGSFLDIDMEYIGPYLGAAYAIPVADVGSAVLSGSIAYLFGEAEANLELNGGAFSVDVEGESVGSNIGAAWSGTLAPISSALSAVGYTVGVDYSVYQFRDNSVDEYKEQTVRGRFDIRYRF